MVHDMCDPSPLFIRQGEAEGQHVACIGQEGKRKGVKEGDVKQPELLVACGLDIDIVPKGYSVPCGTKFGGKGRGPGDSSEDQSPMPAQEPEGGPHKDREEYKHIGTQKESREKEGH